MIKKLLLLKNIIKSSTEKMLLESLIRQASAERGSFTSELMPGATVPDALVNALSFRIGSILPGILSEYYPDEPKDKINNYVNNNKTLILFEEIETPEGSDDGIDKMSVLDHYLYRSTIDYPSEEEAIAEEYTSFPAIDVDAPPASSDLSSRFMPEEDDDHIPEYDEKVSEEILRDLLYTFVESAKPFGEFPSGLDTLEMTSEESELDYDDDISKDELSRFLAHMNKTRTR